MSEDLNLSVEAQRTQLVEDLVHDVLLQARLLWVNRERVAAEGACIELKRHLPAMGLHPDEVDTVVNRVNAAVCLVLADYKDSCVQRENNAMLDKMVQDAARDRKHRNPPI